MAFSFYAMKNLTTGEGGMVTAKDPEIYDRMRLLCPRSSRSSSTSRYDNEYRRYQRTAQRMSAGSLCRHLKIAGRVAMERSLQPTSLPLPKLQHIRTHRPARKAAM